jgi:hypothetical protein
MMISTCAYFSFYIIFAKGKIVKIRLYFRVIFIYPPKNINMTKKIKHSLVWRICVDVYLKISTLKEKCYISNSNQRK